MIIDPIASAPPPPNTRIPAKTMNQQDFLKLFISQLQNQDPLKPQDGGAMVTQMSQISSIQSMLQLQQGMTQLGTNQQVILGQSLLDRRVQVVDADGKTTEGTVQEVTVKDSDVKMMIGGNLFKIADLRKVLPDLAPAPQP